MKIESNGKERYVNRQSKYGIPLLCLKIVMRIFWKHKRDLNLPGRVKDESKTDRFEGESNVF